MNYCFNLTQIIIALVGAMSTGAFISIRITKSSKKRISQNRNIVSGGDIVGGDKITK